MSKKNFLEACREQTNYTVATSRGELELFCEIMGLPKSKANYFIGDDPHGVVDIMEGYYCLNMTDIHVVISEYEHWMEIYKTNEELRKEVDKWYYYCQDWYEQHSYEEPRWVSVKERLPKVRNPHSTPPKTGEVVFIYTNIGVLIKAIFREDEKIWHSIEDWNDTYKSEDVTHWKPIITPEQEAERSKGCPNLRSWLAGCPVDGLREATPEWKEEQRKAQEAAHQRVEECKQALEDAIKEEVKLNKF